MVLSLVCCGKRWKEKGNREQRIDREFVQTPKHINLGGAPKSELKWRGEPEFGVDFKTLTYAPKILNCYHEGKRVAAGF